MNLVKGEGQVFPKPGKSFDPGQIPKAIQGAGFTATEVNVVVEGTLATEEGQLRLDVPGIHHPFALVGGAQQEVLKKRTDLLHKRVRLTGKLQLNSSDRVAGLTVEEFQLVP